MYIGTFVMPILGNSLCMIFAPRFSLVDSIKDFMSFCPYILVLSSAVSGLYMSWCTFSLFCWNISAVNVGSTSVAGPRYFPLCNGYSGERESAVLSSTFSITPCKFTELADGNCLFGDVSLRDLVIKSVHTI